MRIALRVLALIVALSVSACGGGSGGGTASAGPSTGSTTPDVTFVGPTSGSPGTNVTIQGVNLGSTAASNVVKVNGVQATVTSASATSLAFTVPPGATTGKLTIETGGWIVTLTDDFIVSNAAPSFVGFTPQSGVSGTSITISGANFGVTPADNTVWINGTSAPVTAATNRMLTVTVPPGATTGLMTIQTAGGTVDSTASFTVNPTIVGFSPASGFPGSAVTITGTNFDKRNKAFFWNGIQAQVTAVASTSMSVVVPNGATTGAVGLETPAGDFFRSTTNFKVTSQFVPTITSFTPNFGKAGTTVTVKGANFKARATDNVVRFSGVAGTVTFVSTGGADPFLWVTVPSGPNGTGPISITTIDGTGTSSDNFAVQETPPPTSTVSISPASVSAGSVTVGGAYSGSVTLTNTGTLNASVGTASVSGSGFTYDGTTCFGYNYQLIWFDTLAPGSSCTISVMFAPTSVGPSSGMLSFSTPGGGGTHTVSLSGTGVAPLAPVTSFSSTALAFAARELGTTSEAQTIRLSNAGTAALSIAGINVAGEFAQSNDCPANLAVGASCNIIVSFAPIRFVGTKSGVLSVATNAASGPNTVQLTGAGSLAKSGRLALYTRQSWGIDNVYVDGAWVGRGLKYDSQDTCGGLGAITLTLAPGVYTISADASILAIADTTDTVTENGCTVHKISGTSTCVSPNFVSGGYCYPPALPTCVAPQVLQNGACVTPGTSTGTGSGSGGTGGGSTGGTGSSGAMAAPFDSSGGGSNAANCLTFGLLTGEAASFNDTQTIKNACNFPVYVLHCHSASTRGGTSDTQCGYNGRFFQQFYWLKPGETKANSYSLPPNTTIWYGACSGGDLPVGKEVATDGHYICK